MTKLNHFFFFLILLVACNKGNATAQYPEVIVADSITYYMMACPLEDFAEMKQLKDKYDIHPTSTALWRGYIGYWHLSSNRLYIDSISVSGINGPKIIAKNEPLFKPYFSNEGVLASWFNGEIKVVSGDVISYTHMGFESTYQYEDFYTIKHGVITNHRNYHNKSIFKGKGEIVFYELEQHILGLHPGYTGKVAVFVSADKLDNEGNLKKIKVEIGTCPTNIDIHLLKKEIEEYLLENIPFDIIYDKGQYKCNEYGFCLVFDNDQREFRKKRTNTLRSIFGK